MTAPGARQKNRARPNHADLHSSKPSNSKWLCNNITIQRHATRDVCRCHFAKAAEELGAVPPGCWVWMLSTVASGVDDWSQWHSLSVSVGTRWYPDAEEEGHPVASDAIQTPLFPPRTSSIAHQQTQCHDLSAPTKHKQSPGKITEKDTVQKEIVRT